MFAALSRAFRQLGDPAFRRVFALSVAAALAVFLVLWALAWWGLAWSGEALSQWLAAPGSGGFWTGIGEWIFGWLFGAAGVFAVLMASFFLFPAVMVLAMSFLLEDVAAAVERRYYPGLPPARIQPIGEAVVGALVFAVVTVALNLLFLPVYLLLLFAPPLNLFVFYLLNGYLLGREYFELVALRRLDAAGVAQVRRGHRGRILLAGVVIAFLLTLPLLNLAMPIVATGFMLHVFEALRPTGGPAVARTGTG